MSKASEVQCTVHRSAPNFKGFAQVQIESKIKNSLIYQKNRLFPTLLQLWRLICDLAKLVTDSKNYKQINAKVDKEPTDSYPCKKCDKTYKSYKLMYGHHTRVHTEKNHLCKFCSKKFMYTSKLKLHERFHTGEKPYACRFCDKNFSQQYNRSQHERIHTGEKPYACMFCGKKFTVQTNKNQHEKIHIEEKPYACEFCDKKFTWPQGRNKHKKMHIREKSRVSDNKLN